MNVSLDDMFGGLGLTFRGLGARDSEKAFSCSIT